MRYDVMGDTATLTGSMCNTSLTGGVARSGTRSLHASDMNFQAFGVKKGAVRGGRGGTRRKELVAYSMRENVVRVMTW